MRELYKHFPDNMYFKKKNDFSLCFVCIMYTEKFSIFPSAENYTCFCHSVYIHIYICGVCGYYMYVYVQEKPRTYVPAKRTCSEKSLYKSYSHLSCSTSVVFFFFRSGISTTIASSVCIEQHDNSIFSVCLFTIERCSR